MVNEVWFGDHTLLDIFVKTKVYKDGSFDIGRVWLTGIIDAASNMLVGYVLSTNPNSSLIAHAFATATVYKPDSIVYGLPKYFYIDNGKDYCAELLKGLPHTQVEPSSIPLLLNKNFCECGMLEWLGVTTIHAKPYNGRAKTIERVWEIIESEFICGLPGYCGSTPKKKPFNLNKQLKNGEIYTFQQFADYFADIIAPGYNHFSSEKDKPSPYDRYSSMERIETFVPSWRTFCVLKKKAVDRYVHQDGIHLNNQVCWHSV